MEDYQPSPNLQSVDTSGANLQPQLPPEPQEDKQQDSKKEGFKNVLYTLSIIIIAPVLAIILTLFVFQSYQVDGPSMEDTLQNGDRLIVLKLPETLSRIVNKQHVPARGEIIIFKEGGINGNEEEKQLVKRVIGIPGDRVVVRDGGVTVFNSEHPNGYDPDDQGKYAPKDSSTEGNVDITVPKGEIFVLGDNRDNSLDSRYFGTVPLKNVIGKLSLRIFPINNAQNF